MTVQNRTGWTAEAAAKIVTPLTHGDALALLNAAVSEIGRESDSPVLMRDRLARVLLAVDFAARQQAQEPLIGYLAALGLRADEEGDLVARDLAARAIAEARGEILPEPTNRPFLDSRSRSAAIDEAEGK